MIYFISTLIAVITLLLLKSIKKPSRPEINQVSNNYSGKKKAIKFDDLVDKAKLIVGWIVIIGFPLLIIIALLSGGDDGKELVPTKTSYPSAIQLKCKKLLGADFIDFSDNETQKCMQREYDLERKAKESSERPYEERWQR